jgi:hypothetical protein
MRLFRRSFLALAVSVFVWLGNTVQAQSAAAAMVAGLIKASNVRGDVRKVNLTSKAEAPLRNGDTLVQDNAIVTGSGESSAVLVFANGSTVRVGRDSRVEIKQFLMDPLEADIADVAALTREPTKSQTDLRLEYGEVVGNVKTLNHAAGSTFSVSTPAGAAGIRGTTFRIVYRPTGNGQAFNFQLSTSEGVVVYAGTSTVGRSEVSVPVGREVAFTAQINPVDNSIVISPPTIGPGGGPGGAPGAPGGPGGPDGTAGGPGMRSESIPISREAAAALQDATVQIIQVQQQTRFTQVELQTVPVAPAGGSTQGQPPAPGPTDPTAPPVQPAPVGQPTPSNQPNPPGQPGATTPTAPPSAPPADAQRPARPAALPPRTTPGDGR